MLQDTLQCTRGDIVIAMPGNSHKARFFRMTILAVTPSGAGEKPSIVFQKLDHLAELHLVPSSRGKPSRRTSIYCARMQFPTLAL